MTDDGRPAARRIATPQNWALLVWFMIFLGAFTNGAGSIIGVVTAHLMVKRLSETIYGSHMASAVRTFWVGFGGAVIGYSIGSIGFPDQGRWLIVAIGLWSLFRVFRGFFRALREKPIVDPTGWL
jgi:uncharacterized membrane protein